MPSENYQQKPINKVLRQYYDSSERAYLRLGQWFVNRYIDEPWPELFHKEDDSEATTHIAMWLLDNGYTRKIPKPVIPRRGGGHAA